MNTATVSLTRLKGDLIAHLKKGCPVDTDISSGDFEIDLEEISIRGRYALSFNEYEAEGGSDEYGNTEDLSGYEIDGAEVHITEIVDEVEILRLTKSETQELTKIIIDAITR